MLRCLASLAKIIHSLWRNDHLGFKRDFTTRFGTDSVKQAANLIVLSGFIANAQGCFQQRIV